MFHKLDEVRDLRLNGCNHAMSMTLVIDGGNEHIGAFQANHLDADRSRCTSSLSDRTTAGFTLHWCHGNILIESPEPDPGALMPCKILLRLIRP